jgi:O-antigen/teichoic acid export membrane protein
MKREVSVIRRPSSVIPHLDFPRPLSLGANFSWVLAGNVAYALSRWAMIVLLANLGGTEMVGSVALAFALGAPLYSLANLGLRGVLVTDVNRQYAFQDYLGLRLVAAGAAMAIAGGMAVAMGYTSEVIWITWIVGLGKLLESTSDIFHGLLQRYERMDRIGIALAIREPLAVGLLAAGVYFTGNAVWGMVGFPVALGATLLAYDLPNGLQLVGGARRLPPLAVHHPGAAGRSGQSLDHRGAGRTCRAERPACPVPDSIAPAWDLPVMLRLAWLCVPVAAVMAMVTLAANIPRYAIEHYWGPSALGVFVAIAAIAAALGTLVAAIGQSSTPRLARHYASGDTAAYVLLLGKLMAIVGGAALGAVLLMAAASGPVLRLLYGPRFPGCGRLAVYVMSAAVLTNLCGPLGRAIDAARHFWTHMLIRMAGILALVGLLPSLVQRHGLAGAAAAIALSAGLCVILYLAAVGMVAARLRPSDAARAAEGGMS